MFNLYRKTWAAVGFILCLFSVVYAYSDGNGTVAEPYQIASVSDWNDLMKTSSDWNKYFIMTADVNLQGVPLTPVGSSAITFTGVFDGDGYIVSNANINGSSYIGLFGRVNATGKISNLGVEDINITGTSSYVGGLAGANYGTITDCDVTGTVTGSNTYVGGLTGRNLGTITGCYEEVAVTGSTSYVGGLAGDNTNIIEHSFALDPVSGSSNVGGLTGRNSGNITSCYAVGSVAGTSYIGGLVGYISGGSVYNCYSAGAVDGNISVGGLIGYKSAGNVDVNSFWDVNTSDCNNSAGGTGKTTAEMKTLSTFTSTGWDFLGEIANGTEDTWRMCVNGLDYPKFSRQFPLDDFVCPDGVNFLDFAWLAKWWLRTDCNLNNDCDGTDIYTDGTVNFLDFSLFTEDWLQGT